MFVSPSETQDINKNDSYFISKNKEKQMQMGWKKQDGSELFQ